MGFKENIKLFFSSEQVSGFIKLFDTVEGANDFPSLNYFGINFSEENISSLKIYYTFFEKLDLKQIEKILPTTKDFEKYYPFFQEKKTPDLQNTGCAFTLKANAGFMFTKGFHFRFPIAKSKNIYEVPSFLKLTDTDLKNYQGISFEYAGNGQVKKKNYYYITDTITKKKIAEEWGNESIVDAELIEYTEAGDERKIIIWGNEISLNQKKINITFSKTHLQCNEWLEKEFMLKPYFAGAYLNNKQQAAYYHLKKDTSPLFNFDTNKHIDTVGYLSKQVNLKKLTF